MASVKTHMACWNPGTSEVELVPWPDNDRISDKYQMTALASYSDIQEIIDPLELEIASYTTTIRMIVRDGVDPVSAHKVMSKLDEYKAWW